MTAHDHDHDRTAAPMVDEITDFEVLEIALRELCIEKGIFTAEEHRRMTEYAEQIGPTPAAQLVARAWLDPAFKELVVSDPLTASKEVGVDWLDPTGFGTPSDFTAFHVLVDTPNLHHCTITDFEDLCRKIGVRIRERLVLHAGKPVTALPNLLGSLAVYRCTAA